MTNVQRNKLYHEQDLKQICSRGNRPPVSRLQAKTSRGRKTIAVREPGPIMISTVPSIKSQNSRASTRILKNQKTRSGIGMLEGEERTEDLRARTQVLRNSLQGSDGRPASQLHLPDPYPNPRQQNLPGAPRQGQGPKPHPSHRPPSEGRRRGRRRLRTGKLQRPV